MAGRVRMLEIDPDLGEELDRSRFDMARPGCTTELVIPAGGTTWLAAADRPEAAEQLGYLVVGRTVLHRVQLAGRGPVPVAGDVVRTCDSRAAWKYGSRSGAGRRQVAGRSRPAPGRPTRLQSGPSGDTQ
jgi:hypothetical protein